jgi:hypothetical protein
LPIDAIGGTLCADPAEEGFFMRCSVHRAPLCACRASACPVVGMNESAKLSGRPTQHVSLVDTSADVAYRFHWQISILLAEETR